MKQWVVKKAALRGGKKHKNWRHTWVFWLKLVLGAEESPGGGNQEMRSVRG